VIVLGVANRQRVSWRPSKNGERLVKTGRLADPLRQHHDPASVELHDERQFQRANRLEQPRCLSRIGIDQTPAGAMRNPLAD
jgi:hypothetical protein